MFYFLGHIIKALKRCAILKKFMITYAVSVCFFNTCVMIPTFISSIVFHSINQQSEQMMCVK